MDIWMSKVRAGARGILQLLVLDGEQLTKDQIADRLKMSYKSGTFNQYLALLKACELIASVNGVFMSTAFARGANDVLKF